MAKLYGDRWENAGSIGEGGQARIYAVVDRTGEQDQLLVLKELKNLERVKYFEREIEVIRSLIHPNVVRLLDFDLEGPRPYLVSEYCIGGSLDKAKPFWSDSPLSALDLFEEICEGVAHAHSKGIIHRDLKPQNIFLRRAQGPAVVGDFGLSHILDDGERITVTDEVMGSRYYTPPEIEVGRTNLISKKSDTYSLGKVLYWLLSGKVLPREDFRNPDWDLRNPRSVFNVWQNIHMEHINRLLDLMIVKDPEKRRSVDNIVELIPDTLRLIRKEFTPIGSGMRQPCLYCGSGYLPN